MAAAVSRFVFNFQLRMGFDWREGITLAIDTPLGFISWELFALDFPTLMKFTGIRWAVIPRPMFIGREGESRSFKWRGEHGFLTPRETPLKPVCTVQRGR